MYGYKNFGTALRRAGIAFLAAAMVCVSLPEAAARESEDGATTRMLIPVGHTVGVKLYARGVMVVKPPESGTPAKSCGLRSGDVIVRCDDTAVTSIEQFRSLLQTGGDSATLQVRRAADAVTLTVEPQENAEGIYCIGAWIRDSMAGIGTVTYVDPVSGAFGALGHGITDVDTAQLMPFANGSVLPSTVKAVKRGEAGAAGELRGDFDLSRDLGILTANTDVGIFGTLEDPTTFSGEALPVGQAVVGKAQIRSNVTGDRVETYDIEITRVASDSDRGRELTLRVTDSDLLAITGGVVQGMSGSPICQNGKIVGAVTHVLLNDPTKGYGVLLETMLNAAE